MRKIDAFVAKIVNTRLTKIFMAISAPDERLPRSATLMHSRDIMFLEESSWSYNSPEFRERSERVNPRHSRNEKEALCFAAQPTQGGRSCPRPQWGSPCHPPAPAFHVPSQTPGAQSSQCGKQLPCGDLLNCKNHFRRKVERCSCSRQRRSSPC